MNNFDGIIRRAAKEEQLEVPQQVSNKIDAILAKLPEKEENVSKNKNYIKGLVIALACVVICLIVVLPNVSKAYADTICKIPIIGDIVNVVTIRNYKYSDKTHEMNIDVPKIVDGGTTSNYINKDVKELTDILVNQFYEDIKIKEGHKSVNVSHKTVTDNKNWFTLKLEVQEILASSNIYYKYYHIDKNKGKVVYLEDLFSDKKCLDDITKEIKRQMKEEMKKDSGVKYWIEDAELGDEFTEIDGKHNFYFNKTGDLVIPFDKYEVAPGYMGCPEFTIKGDILKNILKE